MLVVEVYEIARFFGQLMSNLKVTGKSHEINCHRKLFAALTVCH